MEFADLVFIQTSARVPGARNDGFLRAKYDIVATTDADCVVAPDWIEQIIHSFQDKDVVLAFGPVTRLYYYTLGCNTVFRLDALKQAGMYKIMDAGDDLEIGTRLRKKGKVVFNPLLKVGFDFRRYEQFGFWHTIFEWYRIVLQGGISDKLSYTRRTYKTPASERQPVSGNLPDNNKQ